MKTLIIYRTKHGTTGKVANLLANKLTGEIEIINIDNYKKIDFTGVDQVILGSSVYAGKVHQSVKSFCDEYMLELMNSKLALFICGMNKKEYSNELKEAFPDLLRKHASSTRVLGGEYLLEKMNFFERMIVKKITGITKSESHIDYKAINDLITDLKNN